MSQNAHFRRIVVRTDLFLYGQHLAVPLRIVFLEFLQFENTLIVLRARDLWLVALLVEKLQLGLTAIIKYRMAQ